MFSGKGSCQQQRHCGARGCTSSLGLYSSTYIFFWQLCSPQLKWARKWFFQYCIMRDNSILLPFTRACKSSIKNLDIAYSYCLKCKFCKSELAKPLKFFHQYLFKNFHGKINIVIPTSKRLQNVYLKKSYHTANNFGFMFFPKKIQPSLIPKYQLNICNQNYKIQFRIMIFCRDAAFSWEHREQHIYKTNNEITVVILERRYMFP